MSPSALKTHDSVVAVLFASRAAMALLPWARAAGVSPNSITAASFACSLIAAGLIASGVAGLLAALLIAFGFVLDCLDGTLARSTGRSTDFGRWLDSLTDLVKVFALIAALAVSALRSGEPRLDGTLAAVALLGYMLCELHAQITRQLPQRSDVEYAARAAPLAGRLRAFGQRIDVAFAIGEVLATIALAAALDRPRLGLSVLAVALPVQFASYGIRFWRHRHVGAG